MSRVFHKNEWYYEVSSASWYETDYENVFLEQSEHIFVDDYVVKFKRTVYDEYGAAKADLAIIDKNYLRWKVVEVELSHHSLSGHVLPQVNILSRARYGESEAIYLCGKFSTLDYNKLFDLMKGRQPEVVVVVNRYQDQWDLHLHAAGADMLIFEVYRSERNKYIFRVDGRPLDDYDKGTCLCRMDPILPRMLIVDSPAVLDICSGEKCMIEIGEGYSEWKRVDALDKVWLIPMNSCPLKTKVEYELSVSEEGHKRIVEYSQKRGS